MKYNVIIFTEDVELPDYTFSIAEKIEKQEIINTSERTLKEKCKAMYDFISSLITKEKTEELLGKFNDSDPNSINIVYLNIVKAYNKPIEDYYTNEQNESMNSETLEKAIQLMDSMKNLEKLQVIK